MKTLLTILVTTICVSLIWGYCVSYKEYKNSTVTYKHIGDTIVICPPDTNFYRGHYEYIDSIKKPDGTVYYPHNQ